jgi:hypothetical protein
MLASLIYVNEVEEARSAMGGSRASRNARSKHPQHNASSLGSSKASELKAELRAELSAELSAELTVMKMAMAEMQARMANNEDVTETVPKVVFGSGENQDFATGRGADQQAPGRFTKKH